MDIDILNFTEQRRDLAKQALGKHAAEPTIGRFDRRIHAVLHCFWVENGHSFRETVPRSLPRFASERSRKQALNQTNGYSQRWMAETSYSTTKRSLSGAVRPLGWYRQFREIVLIFAIINI